MSTTARKARKRAGVKFERKAKTPSGRTRTHRSKLTQWTLPFRPSTDALWRALLCGIR